MSLDPTLVAVGDPSRPAVRRAVLWSLAVSAAFTAFAFWTTQDKAVRVHSPWQDDPYDVAVSFAVFVVPMIALAMVVRVQLCVRDEPVPAIRLRDLLRAARVNLLAVAVTAIADWLAVVLRVHQADWGRIGASLIGALAALSALTVAATGAAWRARRLTPWAQAPVGPRDPDWFDDAITTLSATLARLGGVGRRAARLVRRAAGTLLDGAIGIRRHPVITAAIGCACLWGALAVNEVLRDGGPPPAGAGRLVLLLGGIGTSGLFAIVVAAGSYLRFLRPAPGTDATRPVTRVATRTIWAAAASVPITVAFRDSISTLSGRRLLADTPGHLATMLFVLAAVAAVVGAAVAVHRAHGAPQPMPRR